MDFYELTRGFQQLWDSRPGAVILLFVGLVVFILLVVDTWRHKRRHKKPH